MSHRRRRETILPATTEASPRRGALAERGIALVGVLIVTALLMALAGAMTIAVRSDTQLRGAFASGVTGFYAAEAGLNKGMGEYRNIFLNYNIPTSSDFTTRTVTLGSRTVTYQMTQRDATPPCEVGCADMSGNCLCQTVVIPSGELFAGLSATQYRYIVNSAAKNVTTDTEAAVGAEFLVGNIPLFQFVAFYKNDLEISPGPTMNLQGRVHTNSDLYLNADSGPLRVEDNPAAGVLTVQVSSGKKIFRGRKYDSAVCNGNVWVDMLEDKNPKDSNLDPKELTCTSGVGTREVPVSELALWKGSMISALGNIAIPEPDIIQPPLSVTNGGSTTPGVYWTKADLRIVMHIGQQGRLIAQVGPTVVPFLPYRIEAFNQSGVDVTAQLYNFMMDRTWNNNNSRYPGTMPIFITDVPTAAGCAITNPVCNGAVATNYQPTLAAFFPNARNVIANSQAYNQVMSGNATQFDLDYRRGGFYNFREDKWMLLLNINVRDIILWNQQNGNPFFPGNDNSDGGVVIFATIDGPSSSAINNNYGIRVFGSDDLPCPTGMNPCGIGQVIDPYGVTVATDQALYVLGNFNRGTAGGGPAPRQPASLIGDSVNVLSERYWLNQAACNNASCRDGQSNQALSDANAGAAVRDAQNTWINAAFLGGVDTTPLNGTVGNYNGGLENYPRFHENWKANATLNYQGSFVSLGTPTHVNGLWTGTGAGNSIYNPPVRIWNYDPAFNNAANLPPLTPRFVYVQQVLFTEDFK